MLNILNIDEERNLNGVESTGDTNNKDDNFAKMSWHELEPKQSARE